MEYQKLKPIIFYMQKYRTVICIIFSIVFALTGTWKIVQAREGKLTQEMIRLQKDLAKEVFRFHILANSDVEEDQELKMQVKEAVILYMKEMLPAGADRQETKQWVIRHQEEIEEIAECVIEEQGYSYSVRTEVTKSTFPDKTYGDVMLPAGEYEALRIEIGEAKGQNWWCMLYPSLCFTDAVNAVVEEDGKEKLKDTLTEEEYELVTETKKFKIKWFFFGESK